MSVDHGERAQLMRDLWALQRCWKVIAMHDVDDESSKVADMLMALCAAWDACHPAEPDKALNSIGTARTSMHDLATSARTVLRRLAAERDVRPPSAERERVDAMEQLVGEVECTPQDPDAIADRILQFLAMYPSRELRAKLPITELASSDVYADARARIAGRLRLEMLNLRHLPAEDAIRYAIEAWLQVGSQDPRSKNLFAYKDRREKRGGGGKNRPRKRE